MMTRRQHRRQSSWNDGVDELHPALAEERLDPATSFLYKPRTITIGALGLGLILYYSRTFSPPPEPADPAAAGQQAYHNAVAGVWAVVFAFLDVCNQHIYERRLTLLKLGADGTAFGAYGSVWLQLLSITSATRKFSAATKWLGMVLGIGYSTLQGPVTCMVRPHPAVWRLIHGILVAYLLFCVYLLFQDVGGARQFLRHLFPELGEDLKERSYGGDCRLWLPQEGLVNWKVIKETVLDEFVVAHTIGWWCKALILRDYTLLWALSIGFELMELTFQHMLPNFNECWWDSWILDVAVCNFIGIYTGMQTVKWARAQDYNWTGISAHSTLGGKAKRSLLQFTPYSWDSFEWRAFSTPQRCLQAAGLLLVFLVMEVNAFFLKFILWIPPLNPLNTLRLLVLFLAALPTAKEYYAFCDESSSTQKLGFFAWLYVSLAVVETAVVVKFGRGMFPKPWPAHVLWFWGCVGAAFAVTMAVWSLRLRNIGSGKAKAA